jgi:hypothetical protein
MRSCLASTTKILADRNKKMETELSVFYVKIGINVRRHKELINLLTESIDSSGHESVTTLPLNACSLFLFRYVYKIQIQYFHHQNRFDFKKKDKNDSLSPDSPVGYNSLSYGIRGICSGEPRISIKTPE